MLLFIYCTPRVMLKNSKCHSIPGSAISALGFLHSRTNLSPFTKDFRGEDQFDEYLTIFLRSRFGGTFLAKQNWCLQPEFWKHLFKTALSIERKICAVKKLRKLIQIRFRILFLYLKPQV